MEIGWPCLEKSFAITDLLLDKSEGKYLKTNPDYLHGSTPVEDFWLKGLIASSAVRFLKAAAA